MTLLLRYFLVTVLCTAFSVAHAQLTAPTSLEASKFEGKYLKLDWSQVAGAAGYKIYRGTSEIGVPGNENYEITEDGLIGVINDPTTTSFVDRGPLAGKAMKYCVVAFDGSGTNAVFKNCLIDSTFRHAVFASDSLSDAYIEVSWSVEASCLRGATNDIYLQIWDSTNNEEFHSQLIKPEDVPDDTVVANSLHLDNGDYILLDNSYTASPAGSLTQGLGYSIAMQNNTALVGASKANGNAGAVYVYEKSGGVWTNMAQLTPSDGKPGDGFGYDVAIDGNFAVVSANTDTGKAYVFEKTGPATWVERDIVMANFPDAADNFGKSVAIKGDQVMVGAPNKYFNLGVVYIFRKNGNLWPQYNMIAASSLQFGQQFGYDIDVDGDYLVVGAVEQDGGRGKIYFLRASGGGWIHHSNIVPASVATGDRFGASVAISGQHVVAGAPDRNSARGSIYFFERNGSNVWVNQGEFFPPTVANGERFGDDVALDGTVAAAGVPTGNGNLGETYLFENDGASWSQTAQLTEAGLEPGDAFGNSIGVSGSDVMVGVPGEDADRGAIYVYEKQGLNWPNTQKFQEGGGVTSQTLEMWVKKRGNATNRGTLFADDNAAFNISAPGDQRVNIYIDNSGYSFFNYKIPQNRWTHLALVTDGNTNSTRLYVNGEWVDELQLFAPIGTEKFGSITLGGNTHSANVEVKDLRYWNTAIFAPDIEDRFDKRLNGTETGLQGYWKINEGSGTSLNESTGNYPNATVFGTAQWVVDAIPSLIAGSKRDYTGPDQVRSYRMTTYETGFGYEICESRYDSGATLPFINPLLASDSSRPDSIMVSWVNNSDAVSFFRLIRILPGEDTVLLGLLDSTTTNFADVYAHNDPESFVNGVTYQYCIAPLSTRFGLTFDTICISGTSLPINFQATDDQYPAKVELTWDDMSVFADKVQIVKDNEVFATLPATETTYTDDQPLAGQKHGYELHLLDGSANITASDSDTGSVEAIGRFEGYAVTESGYYGQRDVVVEMTATIEGVVYSYTDTTDITGAFSFENVFFDGTATYDVTASTTEGFAFINIPLTVAFSNSKYVYEDVLIKSDKPYAVDSGLVSLSNFSATPIAAEDLVRLSWDYVIHDTAYFKIFRDQELIAIITDTGSASVTQFDDLDGIPGTSYDYEVVVYQFLSDTSVAEDGAVKSATFSNMAPVASLTAAPQMLAGTVLLNWTHTSTNIDGFELYRNGAPIGTVAAGDPFTWTDASGVPGTNYTYGIRAYVTKNGITYHSDTTFATPVVFPSLATPQNVIATADAANGKVDVSWSYNKADNQNFFGFLITRSHTGGEDTLDVVHHAYHTSQSATQRHYDYADWTGVPGRAYTYNVHTYRKDLPHASPAGSDGATFPALQQVIPFSASDDAYVGYVKLEWENNAKNIDGFRLRVDSDLLAYVNAQTTSYIHVTPTQPSPPTRTYMIESYRIIEGDTIYSPFYGNHGRALGTTNDLLQRPGNFQASEDYPNHIELSWEYPSYIFSRFFIYRDGNLIDSVANNVRYYFDTTAQANTNYVYQIRANYEGKWSAFSGDMGKLKTLTVIEGVAQTQGGIGIPDVRISVKQDGENLGHTYTDATGFYRMTNIPEIDNVIVEVLAERTNTKFIDPLQSFNQTLANNRYTVNFIDTFYHRTIDASDTVAQPTSFLATVDPLTNKVELTWNLSNGNFTGVKLFRELTEIADIPSDSAKYYVDEGANPGIRYEYQLQAYWDQPEGRQLSEMVSAFINVPVIPPVEGLQAIPDADEDIVKLYWSHPTDNHTYYEIKRNNDVVATINTGEQLYYVDSTGLPGRNYKYAVTCYEVSAAGVFNSERRESTARFPEVAPITDLALTAFPNDNRVNVSWTHTSIYYNYALVYRNGVVIDTVERSQLPKVTQDYEAIPDAMTSYAVGVVTIKEEQAFTSDTLMKWIHFPEILTPSIIDTSFGPDEVVVEGTYLPAGGYTGFQFYKDDSLYEIFDTNATLFSFSDPDGIPQEVSIYRVRAYKDLNTTYYSDFDSIEIQFPELAPPFNLNASDGTFENHVEITWEHASTSNDGFIIYRNNVPIDTLPGGMRQINSVENEFASTSGYPTFKARAYKVVNGTWYLSVFSNEDEGHSRINEFNLVNNQEGSNPGDQLGRKVSLNLNYAGAAGRNDSVIVFQEDNIGNYVYSTGLFPEPASGTNPQFGEDIYMTEDKLLVGAPRAPSGNFQPPSGAATVTLYTVGDFNASFEYAKLYNENGGNMGTFSNGNQCSGGFQAKTFNVAQSTLNGWIADNSVQFTVAITNDVNYCSPYAQVYIKISYPYAGGTFELTSEVKNYNTAGSSQSFELSPKAKGEIYSYNLTGGSVNLGTIIRAGQSSYVKRFAGIESLNTTLYSDATQSNTNDQIVGTFEESDPMGVTLVEQVYGEEVELNKIKLVMSKTAGEDVGLKDFTLIKPNGGDTVKVELLNTDMSQDCDNHDQIVATFLPNSGSLNELENQCIGNSNPRNYEGVDNILTFNNSQVDPSGDYYITYTVQARVQNTTTKDSTITSIDSTITGYDSTIASIDTNVTPPDTTYNIDTFYNIDTTWNVFDVYHPGGQNVQVNIDSVFFYFESTTSAGILSGLNPNASLGYGVAGNGDLVYAGSPFVENTSVSTARGGSGIFNVTQNDWTLTNIYKVADNSEDGLGSEVGFAGSTPLLGAPNANSGSTREGEVHVMGISTEGEWERKAVLSASDKQGYDYFGNAIDGTPDDIVIGAYGDDKDDNGSIWNVGSAYIFTKNNEGNWIQKTKLKSPDEEKAFDEFGTSVAINGNLVAVGKPGDDEGETNSGSVYLFERDENEDWIFKDKIRAIDPAAGARFGASVDLAGNILMVGAPGYNGNRGKVYFIYIRDLIDTVIASNGTEHNKTRISWEYSGLSAGVKKFHIYRDNSLIAAAGPNEDFIFDYDGIPGRKYVYRVTAIGVDDVESLSKGDEGWRNENGILSGSVVTSTGEVGVPDINIDVWTTVDGDRFEYSAITDEAGKFKIKRLYYGDSSRVYARAYKSGHIIVPDTQYIEFNLQENERSLDAFQDQTVYIARGNVAHDNFNCPIDSVTVYLREYKKDGTIKRDQMDTDENGDFSFVIDPLNTNIKRYEFEVDSIRMTTNQSVDTTYYKFSPILQKITDFSNIGRVTELTPIRETTTYKTNVLVASVCGNLPGKWKIQLNEKDGCFSKVYQTNSNGFITLDLPPLNYTMRVIGVDNPTPDLVPVVDYLKVRPRSINLLEFHRSLKGEPTDSIVELEFVYHQSPVVSVPNLDNFLCDDPNLPVVVKQGDQAKYTIDVSEIINGEQCHVNEGYLLITNNAADNSNQIRIDLDPQSNTFPDYEFTVGEPNLVAPHIQDMVIEYHTEIDGFLGELLVPFIVEGVGAVPGTDIIVTPSSDNDGLIQIPVMILRDPPGDGSYTYIDSGQTVEFGLSVEDRKTFLGGVDLELTFDPGPSIELNQENGGGSAQASEFELSMTFNRSISTADFMEDNDYGHLHGDNGDVVVGLGSALQYGIAREISVDEQCRINSKKVITTGAEIKTTWVYTVSQIRRLIQEYKDNYEAAEAGNYVLEGKTKEETKTFLEAKRLNWEKVMEYHSEKTLPHYALCDPNNYAEIPEPWKTAAADWRENGFCSEVGFYTTEGGKKEFHLKPKDQWNWNTDLIEKYNKVKQQVRDIENYLDYTGPLTYSQSQLDNVEIDKGYAALYGPDAKNVTFAGGANYSEEVNVSRSESVSHEQFWYNDTKISIGATFDNAITIVSGAWAGFGGGAFIGTTTEIFSYKIDIKGFFGFKFEYNESTSSGVNTDQTVGFELADDDDGDQYSVNIIRGVQPTHTPYFDLFGGRSSCPAEPGAIPRDICQLDFRYPSGEGFNPNIFNADPDKPVIIPIQMSNLNPFNEDRWYELWLVENTNPLGANISVNGRTISTSGNEEFYIPADGSVYAYLTFTRNPFFYDFEDIQIGLRSNCDAFVSDVQTLNVHFRHPCSDVSIIEPGNDWTINSDTSKQLVKLTDYDPYNDQLKRLQLVYRKIGTMEWDTILSIDKQTLQTYFEVNKPTYPTPTYPFIWDVNGINYLPDGRYELMTIANCGTGGLIHSNRVQGTIDRSSFRLFGKPQPADGLLSLGDEISVAYNKAIDCPVTNAKVTYSFRLDSANGQLLNAEMACYGNGLTFLIDSLELYEGRMIHAMVDSAYDKSGNLQKDTILWSFEVSNNPVFWDPVDLELTVEKGEQKDVTAWLQNTGTGNEGYMLMNAQPWLGYDPAAGVVLPSGRQITFTIDASNLAVGTYYDTVDANITGFNTEQLTMKVNVYKPTPNWSVDGSDYEHNISVIANANIDSVGLSTDTSDVILAYIDGELRGFSNVQQVGAGYHAAYLTVYGNDDDDKKSIDFRVWDGSRGALFQGHPENPMTFMTSNHIYGTTINPELIRVDTDFDSLRFIPLDKGWNWFSLNTYEDDMSVGNVLRSLTANTGDVIMTQTSSAEYLGNAGWVNMGLDTIRSNQGYMLYLHEADTLLVSGRAVSNIDFMVLQNGWTWIGYQPQEAYPIKDAFLANTPAWEDGDVVKSQEAFSIYNEGDDRWEGNLDLMQPYEAYKVRSGSVKPAYYRGSGPATWNVNEHAYENTMRMIVVLNVDGYEFMDNSSMAAAFKGSQPRGVGELEYIAEINRYVAQMIVYGNEDEPESNLKFYIWDALADTVYECAQEMAFLPDQLVGDLRMPFHLSPQETTGINNLGADGLTPVFDISPNPFTDALQINFKDAQAQKYVVELYNGVGEIFYQRSVTSSSGENSWKIKPGKKLASGMYYVTIKVDGRMVQTFKVVKE